jgi:4-amino-4-deoxy-L-arabinose transferase-like glycosyltransferase
VNKRLLLVLLLALALRLGFGLAQDPLAPYSDFGGDTGWYLANSYALIMGHQPGEPLSEAEQLSPANRLNAYALFAGRSVSYVTQVSQLPTPPLYLIITGAAQALFDRPTAMIAVRVLQALMATATCYFVYRLARWLTGRENAGLLAALGLAISPVFIIEASLILSETVFVFLLVASVWLYVESLTRKRHALALLVLAGVLLGAATLTRAVLLAFPFGLAIHLLLVYGWRRGLGRAALLLLVYALTVSTWTVYTMTQWNRFVIAGEGLPAFFYMGAEGWGSAQEVDAALAEQSPTGDYVEAAGSTISANPLGWAQRRVSELAGAYLQPHGTTFFGGESLRELARDWLRDDRSPAGLLALVQRDSFLPKLSIYLFHYAALALSVVGMWRARKNWRVALALLGVIAYFTLVHLALYALPRYLFPLEAFFYIFAVAGILGVRKTQEREAWA